jgi:peroxiredoxin
VSKGVLHPILLAMVAVLAGLPAYLLAEHLHLLPPALRDRPWPLDAVVLVSFVGALSVALSSKDRRGRPVAFACSVAAALSLLALVSYAHVMLHELPPASQEVSVGRKLPDLSFPDDHGGTVALGSLRGRGAVLLLFRGVFCPSCRAQLEKIAERAKPFLDAGVRVLGVSPDPPDVCAEWSRSVHLAFPLLSDEGRRLAPALCGTSEHCVLVIDPEGVVRWGRLNENWRAGARPEAVLQRAYRLGRP